MSYANRPGKTDGGTSVAANGTIYAADWNGDIDEIYNKFNGDIEDINIKAGAGIDPTKIDDYSTSDAEAITIATPGTTDAPAKATSLDGELARLRYNDVSGGLGASCLYHNGTANATIGPWDGVRVGNNLVHNGSLQVQTGGSGTAPDGWTLVNTPGAVHVTATAKEGGARPFKLTGGGTADGIAQTIKGVKADALYVIGCRARAGANAGDIAVTGGLSTGAFQNTNRAIAVAGTNYTTYSLAVKADAAGSDMTITLTTGATSLDELYVLDVFMFEVAKDYRGIGKAAVQKVTLATQTSSAAMTGTSSWVAAPSALNVAVTPYRHNQRVIVDARLSVNPNLSPAGAVFVSFVRMKENSTVVSGPRGILGYSNLAEFQFVHDNPTPGTALTYSFEVYDHSTISSGTYDFAYLEPTDSVQLTCEVVARVEDID